MPRTIRLITGLFCVVFLAGSCAAPAEPPTSPISTPQNRNPSPPSASATGTPTKATGTPTNASVPSPSRQLPRGGTTVFPRYRLVGYAGLTGARTLGRLGTGKLDQRVTELERRAKPYAYGRTILPVLEVIATIVHASPGRDGLYRSRLSGAKIKTYLKAARAHKAILLLNIQPGRAKFLDEAKAYDRWLRQPDVGLALDPEWAMGPGQTPGRVFGHTTGATLDGVSRYLSDVVRRNHLPEKVLVYHQLAPRIVRREARLKPHVGVAVVKSVDGIGSRAAKVNTYHRVNKTTPKHVHAGFKLFYTEDRRSGPLMTPQQVMRIKPQPEYILYE